ncbi:zinc ribbon domain-containing protein [Myxococcota bacterium]|nr:zinc ribbon domain-containing protein [Myxococcota bacterium]
MRAPPLTTLADRRAEGQRQVRAAGLRAGGRAPYGFVLVRILVGGRPRTTLALGDRREVATLRALARLLHRLGSEDPRAVAQVLNAQGHLRRGRRWTAQDVRRALVTPAYTRWVPGWPEAGGVAGVAATNGDGAATEGGRSASKGENRAARLIQPSGVASGDGDGWRGGDAAFDAEMRASGLTQPSRARRGDRGDGRERASEAGNRAAGLTQPSEVTRGDGGREKASKVGNRGARLTQPSDVVSGDGGDGHGDGGRDQAAKAENRRVRLTQPSRAMSGDGLLRRLRCGCCGCTMRQRVTSAKAGEPRRYLACTSGDRGRPCGARWWRREVLEGLLSGVGRDQGGLIEVGEAGVSLISSAPAARPTPFEEGLVEHIVALKAQLDRVEAQLAGLSEARSPTEALLERALAALELVEARTSEELKAVAKRGDEEDERGGDDGLGALTALVVAALRALVMLVPELPVTGTVAAKILGIQRAKLDGGDVAMVPLGRALVAPFGLWLAKAFTLVPPPPGLGLLIGGRGREGDVGERGRQRGRRPW